MGSVAKSYMRKGFLIHEEMRKKTHTKKSYSILFAFDSRKNYADFKIHVHFT